MRSEFTIYYGDFQIVEVRIRIGSISIMIMIRMNLFGYIGRVIRNFVEGTPQNVQYTLYTRFFL